MSPKPKRFAFVLAAGTNWLAFAAVLLVSFFLTPHLIGSLGKARYDVWCVVESVLAYLTLLDMGVAVCLVRYVARHHAKNERENLNRIASACLGLFTAAGLLAMIVGTPILLALTPRLSAKLDVTENLVPFMLLMLANVAITLPLSLFPSILDGLEKFVLKSVVRLVGLAVRTTAILIVLQLETGLFPLAIVFTLTNLVEHALYIFLSYRLCPGLHLSWRLIDRAGLKEVRLASVDAFLAMLAGRITVQTGAIVTGLFLPAGQVTFFVTAARLVDYAKNLLRQITTTLTPGVSAREARGDHDGIRQLLLQATHWVLYIVLPVQAGLVLFGRPFLSRWVGEDFIGGSYPAMLILSVTVSIGVAQSVAARILYGLGQLKLFARLALTEAGLHLLLLVPLVSGMGVVGVAWAVAVPNLLFCAAVITITARRLEVSLRSYLAVWVSPLLTLLLPITIWQLLGEPEASWVPIFSHGLAGVLAYALLVLLVELRLARRGHKPAEEVIVIESRVSQPAVPSTLQV